MAHNKYLFKGSLHFSSALHIGGGQLNETNTDLPIVKTPDGLPYIPGSSIKGVFRSLTERIATQINGLKSCLLSSENKECYSSEKSKWKPDADFDGNPVKKTETQIFNELEQGLCNTCKLFGSTHRASKVFFKDLNIQQWAEMTQIRDGVAIDRDSGTAVPNLKYDYEVLPVDAMFAFQIMAEDLDDTDLGLLSIGLNELVSGNFQVGGKTTRGLGNCQLDNFEIYKSDWEDPEKFKKYILGQTDETKYEKMTGGQAKQFLIQKIERLFQN